MVVALLGLWVGSWFGGWFCCWFVFGVSWILILWVGDSGLWGFAGTRDLRVVVVQICVLGVLVR